MTKVFRDYRKGFFSWVIEENLQTVKIWAAIFEMDAFGYMH